MRSAVAARFHSQWSSGDLKCCAMKCKRRGEEGKLQGRGRMNDSIFKFSIEKQSRHPLIPTAWPKQRTIIIRPHLSIALFYLLYGLPETSLFPKVTLSRSWEW